MRTLSLAVAFVAVSSIGLLAINSDAPSPSAPSSSSSPSITVTPEMQSIDAFNSGVKHLNNGDKAGDKNQKKALDEYGKALKDFQRAVQFDPKNHRAFNGLGYSYRKTGNYDKALESYDTALKLSPGFPDAIEYRAEAYLGLNRLDDAKSAYMALFATSPKHADALLQAMKTWVEKRHADPAGIDPTALSTFEGWLHERAGLAVTTQQMARQTTTSDWR